MEEKMFEEKSILLMLALSLITFGIYIPYWFLRQRDTLNRLSSSEKLGSGAATFVFVIFVFPLFIGLFRFLARMQPLLALSAILTILFIWLVALLYCILHSRFVEFWTITTLSILIWTCRFHMVGHSSLLSSICNIR